MFLELKLGKPINSSDGEHLVFASCLLILVGD